MGKNTAFNTRSVVSASAVGAVDSAAGRAPAVSSDSNDPPLEIDLEDVKLCPEEEIVFSDQYFYNKYCFEEEMTREFVDKIRIKARETWKERGKVIWQMGKCYNQQRWEQLSIKAGKLYLENAKYNSRAAMALCRMNCKGRSPYILDLHYLYVPEALEAVDLFLDHHISMWWREVEKLGTISCEPPKLLIITGRGKHSTDNVPKLRPAVEARLLERGLEALTIDQNPGAFKVNLEITAKFTFEVRPAR